MVCIVQITVFAIIIDRINGGIQFKPNGWLAFCPIPHCQLAFAKLSICNRHLGLIYLSTYLYKYRTKPRRVDE